MNRPVSLVLSLDVEEEGLFRGIYARRGHTTANTAALYRLEDFCRLGVRPTLFCAYSVMEDVRSRKHLAHLCQQHSVELGAHLHHWNTPPLTLDGSDASLSNCAASVSAFAVPVPLMAAKLHTLLERGRNLLDTPLTSFRMGRWDAHQALWPLLVQEGILADASVRPLHCYASALAGPDHFDAPGGPYWITTDKGKIFELPLSVTPLLRGLPALLQRLPDVVAARLKSSLRQWGVLALLPVYHPLWLMKLVARLYVERGGQVLSLTWHSSEMAPGATPHIPDVRAVDRLLAKALDWIRWLFANFTVRCLTLGELAEELGPSAPAPCGEGDWSGFPPQAAPSVN